MTPSQATLTPLPRTNKRASRRQPPKGSTKARATPNALGLGANIAAGVLDISETGVRLMLAVELSRGQEFEVTLESVASRPIKRSAEVVWSVATADGRFLVGARFSKAIGYAELQGLARQS
jgi:hypothetical protein